MSKVDDRVVQIKFDNAGFESAIRKTLDSLAQLKKSTEFSGSSRGMNELTSAARKFNLGPVSTAIDSINSKFLAMATIGITALSNIANRAVDTGISIAKSLTVDPIANGLREYETNLNSIQTILANTQASGATLKDVTAALDELNRYSDQTIYNFSEMARNIGTFTAAGVDLQTSTESIKGIANLAALSGSNSQQASTAMYQLSQAISAGKVSLQDWNSVVNAGMGGTVFQRALAETAVAVGTLDKNAVKLTGSMKNVTVNGQSFRQALSAEGKDGKSWLTTEVLTKALKQFTGDLTNAELKAMGFNQAQIKAIQAQAKTAQDAATKVKTLSQTLDVAKETAQSGWSQTWRYIFGDFNEAKGSFTELSEGINGFINASADARNAILKDWKFWGGRDAAIDALREAFRALSEVIRPIKEAFRELFPRKSGKELADITKAVRDFFAGLKVSEQTADNIKRTFAGFFAVLKIGVSIVKGIFNGFKLLLSPLAGVGGGILEITAKIGDFLVNLSKAVEEGQYFTKFFEKVAEVIQVPLGLIAAFASSISTMFDSETTGGISDVGSAIGDAGINFGIFADILERLQGFWSTFVDSVKGTAPFFQDLGEAISSAFGSIGDQLGEGVSNIDWDKVLNALKVGIAGGFLVAVIQFLRKGFGIFFDKDLTKAITEAFTQLTDTLKAMQQEIKSRAILNIAIAVAVLAAALFVISKIDIPDLVKGLLAIAALFKFINKTLSDMDQVKTSGPKLIAIGAALILLSIGMLILAFAVKKLGEIDLIQLALGLGAVTAMLLTLPKALQPLADSTGDMTKVGFSIILVAAGLYILASAVEKFGLIDPMTLVIGLAAVAIAIASLGQAMRSFPNDNDLVKLGVGLILTAVALRIMVGAIAEAGALDLSQISKALIAFGGTLLLLGVALKMMPQDGKAQLGLLLVSFALKQIADVLSQFGETDLKELIQGLVALAAVMAILSFGMAVFAAGVKDNAQAIPAFLAMTAALFVMSKIIKELGQMPIEQVLIGLGAIAAVFVILGVAGAVLGPVIPVILGLGIAVALLGAGLALIGVGAYLFASALQIIVNIASLGIDVLNKMLDTVRALLPKALDTLKQILLGVASLIQETGPAFTTAFISVLISMIEAANDVIPPLMELIGKLVEAAIVVLEEHIPNLVDAGYNMLIGILEGIRDNIGEVIDVAGDIIIEFIEGIGAKSLEITTAAADTLITFINGLSDAIDEKASELDAAVSKLVDAIWEALKRFFTARMSDIGAIGRDIGGAILNGAMAILEINSPSKAFIEVGKSINEGLVKGVVGGRDQVKNSLSYIRQEIRDLVQDTRKDLKEANENLKKLREDGASEKEIAKAEKAVAKAEAAYKRAVAANKKFNKAMKQQRERLKELGREYDKVTAKLEAAESALEDAISKRDSFKDSTKDAFDDLPDIADLKALREELIKLKEAQEPDEEAIKAAQKAYDEALSLDNYFDDIREATAENSRFLNILTQLRNMGLSDLNYEKFIGEGVTATPFLEELLAAGPETVKELNNITSELDKTADTIGTSTSRALYQAGVDAAQGLVNGLKADLSQIEAEMERLGALMAAGLKKALGIKSPSRVFAKIGKQSTDGLAMGLKANSNVVDLAAKRVGNNASEALRKAMSNITTDLDADMDISPVIAPVLDLDQFRKDARGIDKILTPAEIRPTTSAVVAADISASQPAATGTDGGDTIIFEYNQTNNSPTALSAAEIYRQTSNQLSSVKGALSNAN